MKLYPALTDRLRTQHEAIAHIVSGAGKDRLAANPSPGVWSIHDNIAHLARYQPVFIERVKAMLEQDEPLFGRYRAEDDPDFEAWRKRRTAALLETLAADRKQLVKLVEGLSEEQLGRIGRHAKFGRLTLVQWTEFFLLHESHHLFTMFLLANDTAAGS